MVKSNKIETSAMSNGATPTPEMVAWAQGVADTIVMDGDRKIRLGDVPVSAVAYLAHYGLGKSLDDSVSGLKTAIEKAYKATDTKARDKFRTDAKLPNGTESEVTTALTLAKQTKRFDAIVAGTMPIRHGSKMAPRDRYIRDTLEAEIAAIAKAKKRDLPEDAAYEALFAGYAATESDGVSNTARVGADYDAMQSRLATLANAANSLFD